MCDCDSDDVDLGNRERDHSHQAFGLTKLSAAKHKLPVN